MDFSKMPLGIRLALECFRTHKTFVTGRTAIGILHYALGLDRIGIGIGIAVRFRKRRRGRSYKKVGTRSQSTGIRSVNIFVVI